MHDSNVTNSRLQKRSNSVWRRRKCPSCAAIWTSLEHTDYATAWRINKDGTLLIFHYERLYISLYEALKHKDDADMLAKHLTDTVIARLTTLRQPVIPVEKLRSTCYETLRRFDKLAADIYKATYSPKQIRKSAK